MKYQKQLFENEKEDNFAAALRQMIHDETAKAITEHEEKKNTPTKESIFAIKDRAERQKAIRENMHLFK